MLRLLLLSLFCVLGASRLLAQGYDGPPIVITSPDKGTTYSLAQVKSHSLIWNRSTQTLEAQVTFIEDDQGLVQQGDDTHRFRLPGVTYDQTKGIFYATSATGEVIPVAHKKKTLFITTIEPLPNAAVRISHPRGVISVTLEAIRPGDLAKQKQQDDNPDDTHPVDLNSILH